jgi:hypothetical protein
MKKLLLFILSFVALTVPLTWLWLSGGEELYARAITPIAREIYELLGVTGRGTLKRMRFINLIPFTTLMLLTPRLSLRRRLVGLLVGWIALVASHIALNGYAMVSRSRGQLPPTAALASDAMPFLLWFLIARDFVRETLRDVRGERRDEAEQSGQEGRDEEARGEQEERDGPGDDESGEATTE